MKNNADKIFLICEICGKKNSKIDQYKRSLICGLFIFLGYRIKLVWGGFLMKKSYKENQ